MQDRPTATELLETAREFCERDLLDELSGRKRFHVRVLINVLGILEREWAGEEDAARAEWDRVRDLLGHDEGIPDSLGRLTERLRVRNAELSARIRAGELDERTDEVVAALRATVADKLRIANPGYAKEA